MQRADTLKQLQKFGTMAVDVLVVGGGATGLGIAVDAAQRGLKTVLLEAEDFAKGTSSRATKLLHGGVRYLERGDVKLVREALHERETVIRNAPHVAQPLAFVTPADTRWHKLKYSVGLKAYEWLAGKRSLGRTQTFSAVDAGQRYGALQPHCLQHGAVQYWDAQFDDARLALELALKARELGAVLLNHCAVERLLFENGKVVGVQAQDALGGVSLELRAGCVINATGVWADGLRQQAQQAAANVPCAEIVQPSQGAHVVLPRRFWPYAEALLVPKTADGRVLFAVPWLGKVVVGTTDTEVDAAVQEPVPFMREIDFILQEVGKYLQQQPTCNDVLSVWAGLRPLVQPQSAGSGAANGAANTASISREHTVEVAASGLVTVVGGKWTTYRSMADDALQQCVATGLLSADTAQCATDALFLGAVLPEAHFGYGARYADVLQLDGADNWLIPAEHEGDGCAVSEAMVRHAVRFEMACTVEDVLARRRRLLFLDAAKAVQVARAVADIMRGEGVQQPALDDFLAVAAGYALVSS